MKTVEVWQWRRQWAGRWRNTNFKCTEEFIMASSPNAIRVPGTMEVRTVLEPGDPWPNADLYPHGVMNFVKEVKPATQQPSPDAEPGISPLLPPEA